MATVMAEMTPDQDILAQESENALLQYVTFQIADELFGFAMDSVQEIIRLPKTIQVPLTPAALVGLANLRGCVLPVLDLRTLLQLDKTEYNDNTRVIVCSIGKTNTIGLIVDRVLKVMDVDKNEIDVSTDIASTINTALLTGVINQADEPLVQLLELSKLIQDDFSQQLQTHQQASLELKNHTTHADKSNHLEESEDNKQLVSFIVDKQEFAFDLLEVEEIVRIPESISRLPKTDEFVLGVINLRGRLLPLVSLRKLFQLNGDAALSETNRIVVINLKHDNQVKQRLGLVVDEVREVLQIHAQEQDSMPSLLLRDEQHSDISHICRLEQGKRLVSVLNTHSMFKHPAVAAAIEEQQLQQQKEHNNMNDDRRDENHNDDIDDEDITQLVIFHLGEQEFAVSIAFVQEITRVPDNLEKVPKTAEFIEGMMNLRGTVLPVVDMRVRFDMPRQKKNDQQRIIVLSLQGIQTGFIVDSVAEVLRLSNDQIETAPNLSADQARIMGNIVNLNTQKRMIQVLTVDELLSEQEIRVMQQ